MVPAAGGEDGKPVGPWATGRPRPAGPWNQLSPTVGGRGGPSRVVSRTAGSVGSGRPTDGPVGTTPKARGQGRGGRSSRHGDQLLPSVEGGGKGDGRGPGRNGPVGTVREGRGRGSHPRPGPQKEVRPVGRGWDAFPPRPVGVASWSVQRGAAASRPLYWAAGGCGWPRPTAYVRGPLLPTLWLATARARRLHQTRAGGYDGVARDRRPDLERGRSGRGRRPRVASWYRS